MAAIAILSFITPMPAADAAVDPSVLAWSDPINLTASGQGNPHLTSGSGPADVVWWGHNDTHRFVEYASVVGPGDPWVVDTLRPCLIDAFSYSCTALDISSASGRTVVGYVPNSTGIQILTRGPLDAEFISGAFLDDASRYFDLLVAPSDRVYLATSDERYQSFSLRLSTDGGRTFGGHIDISLAGEGVWNVKLISGPSGRVGACWEDYRNSHQAGYYPSGFNPYYRQGDQTVNPDIFAVSLDADLTAANRPVRVDDSYLNLSHQVEPTCAFLSDGRMFVGWSDDRVSFQGDFDIYAALSDANVSSFGRSTRIDDGPIGEVTHQTLPSAFGDLDDDVYVAFTDDRDFAKSIYYARVQTNGTEPIPLANHPVPGSAFPDQMNTFPSTLTMGANGAISLAWLGDASTPQLAFARTLSAGGNHPPTCFLKAPNSVSHNSNPFAILIVAADSDGISTLASYANLTLDLAPISVLGSGPYYWAVLDPTSLTGGSYNLTAVVSDRTGAAAACSATIQVDAAPSSNRPPSVSIASPPDGATFAVPFILLGNAYDPDMDALQVFLSFDGGLFITAMGTTNWSAQINVTGFAFGAHTIAAFASDGVLLSNPVLYHFTTKPPGPAAFPTCEFVFPLPHATISSAADIIGRALDDDGVGDILRVEYVVRAGQDSTGGQAFGIDPFVFTLPVLSAQTSAIVNVTVIDREGRSGGCGASFTIEGNDGALPTVSIIAPADGSIEAGGFTARGTANSPDSTLAHVYVAMANGALAEAQGTTNWSKALDASGLAVGSHTLVAYSVDAFGKWSSPARVTIVVPYRDVNGTTVPWILVADRMEASANPGIAGVPITLTLTVTNWGVQSAENLSVVMTVRSADAPASASFTFYSRAVAVPGNGSNVRVSATWIPPAGGHYVLRAVINSDARFPDYAVLTPDATTNVDVMSQEEPSSILAGGNFLLLVLFFAAAASVAIFVLRRRSGQEDP